MKIKVKAKEILKQYLGNREDYVILEGEPVEEECCCRKGIMRVEEPAIHTPTNCKTKEPSKEIEEIETARYTGSPVIEELRSKINELIRAFNLTKNQ